jgi:hypothetical protein
VTEFATLASLTPLQLNGVAYLGKVPVLTKFGPPDAEGVRPYLQFFRQLPPASQARMLGPGLPIDAEQAAAIQAATGLPARNGPPQPCTLKLTPTVNVDQQATPPAYTIQATFSRSSRQQHSAGMFAMTIPRLPNPFTPS